MGIRCACSATASATEVTSNAVIDLANTTGTLTVEFRICPNCFPEGSLVDIEWRDDINFSNSFDFTSNQFTFQHCIIDDSPGVQSTWVGQAIGVNFNGPATLNQIFVIENPNVICGIELTANGHKFVQVDCISEHVDVSVNTEC